jgi:hypothetical protein
LTFSNFIDEDNFKKEYIKFTPSLLSEPNIKIDKNLILVNDIKADKKLNYTITIDKNLSDIFQQKIELNSINFKTKFSINKKKLLFCSSDGLNISRGLFDKTDKKIYFYIQNYKNTKIEIFQVNPIQDYGKFISLYKHDFYNKKFEVNFGKKVFSKNYVLESEDNKIIEMNLKQYLQNKKEKIGNLIITAKPEDDTKYGVNLKKQQ